MLGTVSFCECHCSLPHYNYHRQFHFIDRHTLVDGFVGRMESHTTLTKLPFCCQFHSRILTKMDNDYVCHVISSSSSTRSTISFFVVVTSSATIQTISLRATSEKTLYLEINIYFVFPCHICNRHFTFVFSLDIEQINERWSFVQSIIIHLQAG